MEDEKQREAHYFKSIEFKNSFEGRAIEIVNMVNCEFGVKIFIQNKFKVRNLYQADCPA